MWELGKGDRLTRARVSCWGLVRVASAGMREKRDRLSGAAELLEFKGSSSSWVEEERSPYEWERHEFNEWYAIGEHTTLAETLNQEEFREPLR
jgi:hypothetical protein